MMHWLLSLFLPGEEFSGQPGNTTSRSTNVTPPAPVAAGAAGEAAKLASLLPRLQLLPASRNAHVKAALGAILLLLLLGLLPILLLLFVLPVLLLQGMRLLSQDGAVKPKSVLLLRFETGTCTVWCSTRPCRHGGDQSAANIHALLTDRQNACQGLQPWPCNQGPGL